MRPKLRFLRTCLLFCILFGFVACDTTKDPLDELGFDVLCFTLASCDTPSNTRFGIIGDSWTDLLAGLGASKTLRDFLEKDYGYKLTGATLAGRKLKTSVEQGLHLKVIENAGPRMRYMIVSLGGNDVTLDAIRFTADKTAERNRVFGEIQNNLLTMIRTGNAFKIDKWGGDPLLWFVHGYDYSNVDNILSTPIFTSDSGCRNKLNQDGFTDTQIDTELTNNLDLYNDMLRVSATLEPTMRYIDLRGTLGGPPRSPANMMLDCIHPTEIGFSLLTARLVTSMELFIGGER